MNVKQQNMQNICHKRVLFEKIEIPVAHNEEFKSELYDSVIYSKENEIISSGFHYCINDMVTKSLKHKDFFYAKESKIKYLYGIAYKECIKQVLKFAFDENNSNANSCYVYFCTVIYNSIYRFDLNEY